MNTKYSARVRYICAAAATAALYVVLTMLSAAAGFASGAVQFRISEALCILPLFTPAAVPGLAVGCVIANLLGSCAPYDILFGSLATLAGALGVRALRRLPWLSPLPYVAANVLVLPLVLRYVYGNAEAWWYLFVSVGIGEISCAWALGLLLYYALRRTGAGAYLSRFSGK